jgi:hypothetical protein
MRSGRPPTAYSTAEFGVSVSKASGLSQTCGQVSARMLIQIMVRPRHKSEYCPDNLRGRPVDIASLIIIVLLAGLMLYLLFRLPLAILGNLRAGHRFRKGLAKALDELRRARMLKYLGIDSAAYLHKEQALEIQKQMDRCDNCDSKSRCDQVLEETATPDVEALGFCANIDDLKEMRAPRKG